MNYELIYIKLIQNRSNNIIQEGELHHIIPKCMGGNNEKKNLVRLSLREHFVAHKLLAVMHPDIWGLQFAITCFEHKGVVKNSRDFEKIKLLRTKHANSMTDEHKKNISISATVKWRDPDFRNMMSEKVRNNWNDVEYRQMMSNNSREQLRKQREDPSFSENISNKAKKQIEEQFSNPISRSKIFDGQERARKKYIRMWMWPSAQPTRHLWKFAQQYYEESLKCVGPYKFSRLYNEGRNVGIFQNMSRLFDLGWIPREDELWVQEFIN